MQNIINDITAKLAAYENNQVDEYNEVVAALEESESRVAQYAVTMLEQNELIKKQVAQIADKDNVLEVQHKAILVQDKNKNALVAHDSKLKKQAVAFQLENKSIKNQLEVNKKKLKSLKEQIKRSENAIQARDIKIKNLESRVKHSKSGDLGQLTTVYSKGNDVLLVYPSKLTIGTDAGKKEQVVLLYTNREGCFVTCVLGENNELNCSTFIDNNADISDRTKSTINRYTMSITSEAEAFAKEWMHRVNVTQKMQLHPADIKCFKG
jgi:hypothetical protein